ncbi:MAG: nucleotidyltransferase domain-containing protein [Bacteroidetes bacterium]|nr:MAG: nucleotidyltransferase domain-containing protein [Bacteroidota bacterium]
MYLVFLSLAMEDKDYIESIKLIKQYLTGEGINISRFYLFGSRARGDNKPDSDYDILIVIDKDFKNGEKRKLLSNIYKFLIANNSNLNIDIVIKPKEFFEWESQNLGFLSYTVSNEGILV